MDYKLKVLWPLALFALISQGTTRGTESTLEISEAAQIRFEQGEAAVLAGRLSEAREHYLASLKLRAALAPGGPEVADLLARLGDLACEAGEVAQAESRYRSALTIEQALDPGGRRLAEILVRLGSMPLKGYRRPDTEALIEDFSSPASKSAGKSAGTADAAKGKGGEPARRNSFTRAADYLGKALHIQEGNEPEGAAAQKTRLLLGEICYYGGDLKGAREHLRRSHDILQKKDPAGDDMVQNLRLLARTAQRDGELSESCAWYSEALELAEKRGSGTLLDGDVRRELGHALALKGEFDLAERHLQRALEIASALAPGTVREAASLHRLANLYRREGAPSRALEYCRRAVDSLEIYKRGRHGRAEAEQASAFRSTDIYRDLIEMQVPLGNEEQAFHTLELLRAQDLWRILGGKELDYRKHASPGLLEKKAAVDREIESLLERLADLGEGKDRPEIEKLAGRIKTLRAGQADALELLRGSAPAYTDLLYPRVLDAEESRRIFGSGSAYVSFSVGVEKTVVFVLRDGRLRAHTVAVSRATLSRSVERFRSLMGDPTGNPAEIERQGAALYQLLLQPAEETLRSVQKLYVSPEGPLRLIPFGALKEPGRRYLIESRTVAHVLSATVHAETVRGGERARHEGSLLVLGDPLGAAPSKDKMAALLNPLAGKEPQQPLSTAREEVRKIGNLFAGTAAILLGGEAQEQKIAALEGRFDFLHFACHGLISDLAPVDSGLVLAAPPPVPIGRSDGILQAWEILESPGLGARLVFMSSLDAAREVSGWGAGIAALTRAFQFSGARAVLYSLWRVSQETTTELMEQFYSEVRKGQPASAALASAQRTLLRKRIDLRDRFGCSTTLDSSHPYFWATFIASGE